MRTFPFELSGIEKQVWTQNCNHLSKRWHHTQKIPTWSRYPNQVTSLSMISPLCSSTCTINFLSVRIEIHCTYGESKRKILFVLVMQFVFYVTYPWRGKKWIAQMSGLWYMFFFLPQPSSLVVSLDVLSLPRFEGKKRYNICFIPFLVYNEAFMKDEICLFFFCKRNLGGWIEVLVHMTRLLYIHAHWWSHNWQTIFFRYFNFTFPFLFFKITNFVIPRLPIL